MPRRPPIFTIVQLDTSVWDARWAVLTERGLIRWFAPTLEAACLSIWQNVRR